MASLKQELRQFGALPLHFERDGTPHVYLVTSRGSGRWIIPKGNPIRGLAPHKVAAREALEEAGLVGHVLRDCIGTFVFDRRQRSDIICRVEVYPLLVERQLRRWAEAGQRSVQSCDLTTALSLVTSPGLSALIEQYMTRRLSGAFLPARTNPIAA
ncbi:NUDIX hydrolase [Mesorhizobium sp. PUT5]|uniref:NUDIX hydrolase n=1 Tax=Mesorhizobium sp. PUT5 TaxID=3454629 RepID=UPI003FA43216